MAVMMRGGCRGWLGFVHPLRALHASPSLCEGEDIFSNLCQFGVAEWVLVLQHSW